MTGAPTPDADSLDGIVIPPGEWVHDTNVVVTPVCDVTAASIDPTTLAAVDAMTAELGRTSARDPSRASPAWNLRALAISCDAEHAAITVDGKAFLPRRSTRRRER